MSEKGGFVSAPMFQTLRKKHDDKMSELKVKREHLAPAFNPEKAKKAALGVRVLQWNILADGLADDGFLVQHVIESDPPTDFRALTEEVKDAVDIKDKVDREKKLKELSDKYKEDEAMMANHSAICNWQRRWLKIRQRIAEYEPDIITFQELDHLPEVQRDLAEMGYSCRHPEHKLELTVKIDNDEQGKRITTWLKRVKGLLTVLVDLAKNVVTVQVSTQPNRTLEDLKEELKEKLKSAGVDESEQAITITPVEYQEKHLEQRDSPQYFMHLHEQRCAFAHKTPSVCHNLATKDRKKAEKEGREARVKFPGDDGCAIFWRESTFVADGLDFAGIDDGKRNDAACRVKLKRKSDEQPIYVIVAHLSSGNKTEEEAKRLAEITTNTLTSVGRRTGPSLLDWFKQSANEHPTLFCLDANSEPNRTEDQTVWRKMHQPYENDGWSAKSVWDDYFDATGRMRENSPLIATTNKMRGPLSDQPRKIGDPVFGVVDHIYYSGFGFAALGLKWTQVSIPPNDGELLENADLSRLLAERSSGMTTSVEFTMEELERLKLRGALGSKKEESKRGVSKKYIEVRDKYWTPDPIDPAHVYKPLEYKDANDALRKPLPNIEIPSDHAPIIVDLMLDQVGVPYCRVACPHPKLACVPPIPLSRPVHMRSHPRAHVPPPLRCLTPLPLRPGMLPTVCRQFVQQADITTRLGDFPVLKGCIEDVRNGTTMLGMGVAGYARLADELELNDDSLHADAKGKTKCFGLEACLAPKWREAAKQAVVDAVMEGQTPDPPDESAISSSLPVAEVHDAHQPPLVNTVDAQQVRAVAVSSLVGDVHPLIAIAEWRPKYHSRVVVKRGSKLIGNFMFRESSKQAVEEVTDKITSVAVHPNGEVVYVGSEQGELAMWGFPGTSPDDEMLTEAKPPAKETVQRIELVQLWSAKVSGDVGAPVTSLAISQASSTNAGSSGASPGSSPGRRSPPVSGPTDPQLLLGVAVSVEGDSKVKLYHMKSFEANDAPTKPTKEYVHKGELFAIAFSEGVIASAGKSKAIVLNNIELTDSAGESGPLVSVKERFPNGGRRHAGSVLALAFSPSHKLLASGGKDQVVKLWSMDKHGKGELLHDLHHQATITALSFAPNGKLLGSADADAKIKLWAPTNKDNEAGSAVAEDEQDTESGRKAWILMRALDKATHDASVSALAFSPMSRYLYSGSEDGKVLETEVAHELMVEFNVEVAAEMAESSVQATPKHEPKKVKATAFSPIATREDGTKQVVLATASRLGNAPQAQVTFHNPETGEVLDGENFKFHEEPRDEPKDAWTAACTPIVLSFSPDGKKIALGGQGNGKSAACVRSFEFKGDGSKKTPLKVTVGKDYFWSYPTDEQAKETNEKALEVYGLAFSPDSTFIAVGGIMKEVAIFELQSKKKIYKIDCVYVRALAFEPLLPPALEMPDNWKQLKAAKERKQRIPNKAWNKTALVAKMEARKASFSSKSSGLESVVKAAFKNQEDVERETFLKVKAAFLLAVGDEQAVRFFDVPNHNHAAEHRPPEKAPKTLHEIGAENNRRLTIPCMSKVLAVSFSTDGQLIASGGTDGRLIITRVRDDRKDVTYKELGGLADMFHLELVREISHEKNAVNVVAFSHEVLSEFYADVSTKRMLVASSDMVSKKVFLHDVGTGELVRTIEFKSAVKALAFSLPYYLSKGDKMKGDKRWIHQPGRLAVGGDVSTVQAHLIDLSDQLIKLWIQNPTPPLAPLADLLGVEERWLHWLASPSGRTLVTHAVANVSSQDTWLASLFADDKGVEVTQIQPPGASMLCRDSAGRHAFDYALDKHETTTLSRLLPHALRHVKPAARLPLLEAPSGVPSFLTRLAKEYPAAIAGMLKMIGLDEYVRPSTTSLGPAPSLTRRWTLLFSSLHSPPPLSPLSPSPSLGLTRQVRALLQPAVLQPCARDGAHL